MAGAVSADYPVFVLAFCIFKKSDYAATVTTALHELKFKYFGHDAVVLHEREIRKAITRFFFLKQKAVRDQFMVDVGNLIERAPFTLVASVIRKEKIKNPTEWPTYTTAMHFGLERVSFFLGEHDQKGRTTHVVFEQRGKAEDNELELAFRRMEKTVSEKGKAPLDVVFAPKSSNHCGHQIADLIARPIGLSVLRPEQQNRTRAVIEGKYRRSRLGGTLGAFGFSGSGKAAKASRAEREPRSGQIGCSYRC